MKATNYRFFCQEDQALWALTPTKPGQHVGFLFDQAKEITMHFQNTSGVRIPVSYQLCSKARTQVRANVAVTASSAMVQHLVKMALIRPEQAVSQMLADDSLEQDLRALRSYPAALISVWRAENASKAMKQMIEDELHAIGMKMMS